MGSVMSGWRERLAALITQAQQAGEVRTDINAQTLALIFWDAWEGAVLRMKVEQRIDPLQHVITLMLDKLLATPSAASSTFDLHTPTESN
jgi:TetR/AcrR family transcriptional repressor of nem operon